MNKFSDFAKHGVLDGSKISLEKVLNIPIVITGFSIKNSKYAKDISDKYTTIQFYFESDETKEKHILFTGSVVLKDNIEEYQDEIPFVTTIVKINKYFAFT